MAGAPEGNKNATKDKRLITDALKRAVTQSPEKLRKACEAILDQASKGDLSSFVVIADRLEGKPGQAVIISGDSENPVITRVERIIVDTPNKDS